MCIISTQARLVISKHIKRQNNISKSTEQGSWSLIVTNAAAQLVVVLIVKQLCKLLGIIFSSSMIVDTAQCYAIRHFNQFCIPDQQH